MNILGGRFICQRIYFELIFLGLSVALSVIFLALTGCSGYSLEAHAKRVGSYGQQVHALFIHNLKEGSSMAEKKYGACGSVSSTAFFNEAMTSGVLQGITSDFFVSASVRKNPGDALSADENIWGITLGLDENSDPNTPFMFTRNIAFLDTANSKHEENQKTTLSGMSGLSSDIRPFGSDLCVIVTWSGMVRILRGQEANQKNFNPSGATNAVLLP